jgi:hypothetical protein
MCACMQDSYFYFSNSEQQRHWNVSDPCLWLIFIFMKEADDEEIFILLYLHYIIISAAPLFWIINLDTAVCDILSYVKRGM